MEMQAEKVGPTIYQILYHHMVTSCHDNTIIFKLSHMHFACKHGNTHLESAPGLPSVASSPLLRPATPCAQYDL